MLNIQADDPNAMTTDVAKATDNPRHNKSGEGMPAFNRAASTGPSRPTMDAAQRMVPRSCPFRFWAAASRFFLIGADGPRSRVAGALGLGANTRFLAGVEYEYAGATLAVPDKLHCFINRRLARGYIGWILAGVNGVQAGLARRLDGRGALKPNEAMNEFLTKIAPVIDLRGNKPTGIRAGVIPCGGVVHPVAVSRALLVGDAAGMVSPVTAGGIHTALEHGQAAGHAVADFLHGRAEDPSGWFVRSYPKFRVKRLLRTLFDHFQTDLAFNWLLATWPMRAAASIVYFHHAGVFDSAERSGHRLASPPLRQRPP